jgi:hypothetical protein
VDEAAAGWRGDEAVGVRRDEAVALRTAMSERSGDVTGDGEGESSIGMDAAAAAADGGAARELLNEAAAGGSAFAPLDCRVRRLAGSSFAAFSMMNVDCIDSKHDSVCAMRPAAGTTKSQIGQCDDFDEAEEEDAGAGGEALSVRSITSDSCSSRSCVNGSNGAASESELSYAVRRAFFDTCSDIWLRV